MKKEEVTSTDEIRVRSTDIPEVLLLEPKVFGDDRGFFFESYNQRLFRGVTGLDPTFVQDNHCLSQKNVLRGLHYQIEMAQGKLVRVIKGEIFDVAVDIRRSSPTLGHWTGDYLSAQNKKQLWIPEGFAHGFLVTSEKAEVIFKTTDFYSPENERSIIWNDPTLGITWPLDSEPVLSPKDREGTPFLKAEVYR